MSCEQANLSTNMATPVLIDPQSFISCFEMALSNKAVIGKLGEVLEPLLLVRDKQIAQLKTDLASERRKTTELEEKLDNLSQWTRNDSLIISGIESQKGETNDECEAKVINLALGIGVNITSADINNVHRLHLLPNGKSNIIVRFSQHKTKVQMMQKKKILRTSQKDIYINEALTPSRAKLFSDARKLVKDKVIKSTWTRDGQIFTRDLDDTHTMKIKNTNDLASLINP